MDTPLIIASRFCGPPQSGNGGYVCGKVGQVVGNPSEVTLRSPPPLDEPMAFSGTGEAGVSLSYGDALVAQARHCHMDLQAPEAPSYEAAVEASRNFLGFSFHPFPTCFVCGHHREEGDGLRIFAGSMGDGVHVAAPWTPHTSLAAENGDLGPEMIWAALDCPGAFAIFEHHPTKMVLGRMAAETLRPVHAEEKHIVTGWYLGSEGRKHYSGTAIYTHTGDLCALAKATWISIP